MATLDLALLIKTRTMQTANRTGGPSTQRRLAATVALFDSNDDELRKAIASKAYVDGGYPFDVV